MANQNYFDKAVTKSIFIKPVLLATTNFSVFSIKAKFRYAKLRFIRGFVVIMTVNEHESH